MVLNMQEDKKCREIKKLVQKRALCVFCLECKSHTHEQRNQSQLCKCLQGSGIQLCMVKHKIIPYYFIQQQQTDWPSTSWITAVLAWHQNADHILGLVNTPQETQVKTAEQPEREAEKKGERLFCDERQETKQMCYQ